MKVRLVVPRWHGGSIWGGFMFRFPYLGVTTLAALAPAGVEVSITDENVEEVDFDEDVDLVGVSALTPLAPRGYEIADRFRARGVKVVIGGVHATWMPEEASLHADSVVIGEAEKTWGVMIDDLMGGALKRFYRADDYHPLVGIPPARRDLLRKEGYFFVNTVQTTRGCPFDCDFCSVTSFYGNTYRCRPVADVEAELATLSGGAGFVFFVDDNIAGRPSFAGDLFGALKQRRIKWLSQASTTLASNGPLLKLAGESGCYGMFVGFETLAQEGLRGLNKNHNRVAEYSVLIRKLHDNGIGVLGSFIFGHDWDDAGSFDSVLEFAEKNRLDGALFTILTPYPGTRVFDRMMEEGRLITTDWRLYDMAHAVFRPKRMTAEELEEGYLRVNRGFYSLGSMFRRLPSLRRSLQVFGPMNWGFRKAWKGFGYGRCA